jgi:Zn-dependent protease
VTLDPSALAFLPVFVLSLAVRECARGLAALALGDPSARESGRLTLDPLPHLDPLGTIVVPGALLVCGAPAPFGWARPAPVDAARLRDPRDGPVGVALAGPLASALMAIACAGLVRVLPGPGAAGWPAAWLAALAALARAGVTMNCALALLHLIPIPPLDGARVLARFLPLRHILALHTFRFAALALLAGLAATPALAGPLVQAPLRAAVNVCLALVGLPADGAR